MDAVDTHHSIGTELFEQAFERALPAMKALSDEEIVLVNLSIPDAVSGLLALERPLLDLKARITSALPEASRDFQEKLVQYAMALSHVHTRYQMATRASDPVPALSEEGMKLRSNLFSDARALIHRGFADSRPLRNYKGSVGYRNLAFDLQMLAQFFRDCASSARGRSAVQPAELRRANELAAAILSGLRKRTRPDPAVEAAADLRNRAFTLFTREYDQVRRSVIYLRWNEGDADEVVPSLYAKRRRAKKKAEHAQTAEQASAIAPAANDG
jgi:hypothetical protein